MQKQLIALLLLLVTSSWATESIELKMQSLFDEFSRQRKALDSVNQTDERDGICLAPTALPVRTEINEAQGRFNWALLPEYYFDYEEDNSGSHKRLNVDYRPNNDTFSIFPAFYGIWMAESYASLESYRDVQIAAGKSLGGATYAEIANEAETYYNGTAGWKYAYKFFSGTSYYVWYSHIVWKDNVAYSVFLMCQESDFNNSLKQTYFTTVLALVQFGMTGVAGQNAAFSKPGSPNLMQNFPNPFNAETCIRFQLDQASRVKLDIYNTLGQKIRTLLRKNVPAGQQQVKWDGRDDQGRLVPSGIYFYRIHPSGAPQTRQMMLVK